MNPQKTATILEILRVVEQAALDAGRHILNTFQSAQALKLEYKADDSMVTNADIEAQEIILNRLGGILPVVAEEDPSSHQRIYSERDFILIDPLDGTTTAKRFRDIAGGQVGFGPLLGIAQDGRLAAGAFVHLPERRLFSVVAGVGVFSIALDACAPGLELPPLTERTPHRGEFPQRLRQCGVLFFPGSVGEIRIVEKLRRKNLIENVYRFGGFANDSTRLARGFEQVQIQFSVKAWDFSAALFSAEVGYSIICDPLGQAVPFAEWGIRSENPLITAPPHLIDELMQVVAEVRSEAAVA